MSVLVIDTVGFVGTHLSLALKKHGDGVVGIDNFNSYYDPSLKKARQSLLKTHSVFIVKGDINDNRLLDKLFDTVAFTHVMHLAAQAGVQYAIENPCSNITGLVMLLEVCKSANPQSSIVWASSSSVYDMTQKNIKNVANIILTSAHVKLPSGARAVTNPRAFPSGLLGLAH
ncbi:UDP-glucuronate 4-epimerase 1 [Pyrus ussuriensis x Pyrus communis]|uniref:UDP-glucuronate 4-epimerase 1 n=1 Tax=Pyrus ussuriensis x Pyrus communis TaxID=2448454 RepID=A0A5N5FTB9_9ROSA|nr:UDP-glucuronate 4-epimerase 1 [Pyrus ussuriensis x Pyrus communis]